MEPLLAQGIEHIVQHKYKSGTWSVFDNILDPWWAWCTQQLPMWMAPNLVTLLGTIIQLLTLAVGEAYRQGLLPWLSYAALQLYVAASLFAYQTLDAMDGKQARRTGSSSPLGQLFDHGCDALVTNVFLINVLASLGLDPSVGLGFGAYAACLTLFYMAQWEEGYSHVLRTNVHGVGVTEGQLTAIAIHVLAAVLPRQVVSDPMLPVPSVLAPLLADYTVQAGSVAYASIATVLGTVSVTVCIVSCLFYMYHVASTMGKPKGLLSLLPSAVLLSSALLDQYLAEVDGRAKEVLSGPSAMHVAYAIAQTHLTTQTIVCSMARQKVPGITSQAAVLGYPLVTAIGAYAGPAHAAKARLLQWVYAISVIAIYLQFAMAASRQITSALGIEVFRIIRTPVQQAKVDAAARAQAASAQANAVATAPEASAPASASSPLRAASPSVAKRSPSRGRAATPGKKSPSRPASRSRSRR